MERSGVAFDPVEARAIADIIVIKTAEWVGVNELLVSVLAVGGILAAISTITGLLVTAAGAVSYDIYYRLINPNANERHLLLVRFCSGIYSRYYVLYCHRHHRP